MLFTRCGFLVLALLLCACSRNNGTAATTTDASIDGPLLSISIAPDASTSSTTPPMTASTDAGFTLTAVAPVEARRAHINAFSEDPALTGLAGPGGPLDKHFAPPRNGNGFDVQSAELTATGRRAVLVMDANKPTSDARPFLMIANEQNAIVWSRERPIGGIMAPVGPIAISAAPLGRVALAACDPPTNIVALRIFDDDGSPFADFQALSVEGCDALSLLYWPRRGFLVVAARAGVTRARLVTEDGSPAWGQPLDLGARSREGAIAPAAIAADTDETFILVQIVQPSAVDGSPFHALAFRYDLRGTAIWPAAVDLGEVPRPASGDRVKLAQTKPGVRVTFPASGKEVDVKPSGDLIPRVRAPR